MIPVKKKEEFSASNSCLNISFVRPFFICRGPVTVGRGDNNYLLRHEGGIVPVGCGSNEQGKYREMIYKLKIVRVQV